MLTERAAEWLRSVGSAYYCFNPRVCIERKRKQKEAASSEIYLFLLNFLNAR